MALEYYAFGFGLAATLFFGKGIKHMRTSQAGIDLIKRFEGFRSLTYDANPPKGDFTIGYGHKLKAGETFPAGITRERAERILRDDLKMAENRVKNAITLQLNQAQFDALVSLAFNLTYNSWMLAAGRFNRGESPDYIFSLYVYGGGVKLAGLEKRRAAEAELFKGVA